MSNELLKGLEAVLTDPNKEMEASVSAAATDTTENVANTSPTDSRVSRRLNRRKFVQKRGLESTFQKQIRWRQRNRPGLSEQIAKMVTLTFLPGDHASDFHAIVDNGTADQYQLADARYARIIVSYRFKDGDQVGIAVVIYRVSVDRSGHVYYGGAVNSELAKNAAITPHRRGQGAALDTTHDETVLRTVLDMDWAAQCVAEGRLQAQTDFNLPQLILGFPLNYTPRSENSRAAIANMLDAIANGQRTLRAFSSPGGTIIGAVAAPGGVMEVSLTTESNIYVARIPRWATLSPVVNNKGTYVEKGTPLAFLPEFADTNLEGVLSTIGPAGVDWLLQRLLEEKTACVTTRTKVYDRQSRSWQPELRTWRCTPCELVPSQLNRSVAAFLNMRGMIGRRLPEKGDVTGLRFVSKPADAVIQVRELDEMPTVDYGLKASSPYGAWTMDFANMKPEFSWLSTARDGGEE